MLSLTKTSSSIGSILASHRRRQPPPLSTICMLAWCDSSAPGDSKHEYSIRLDELSFNRMRSLIAPAPGKMRDLTSPSKWQLSTPGTQSTRSGVPKIAHT
ncbi:MAG: hypothetical protein ACI9W7_001548 [Porticoccaceae bacterium]|jgi:hypothetical protein